MTFGYKRVKKLLTVKRRIAHVLLHPDDLKQNDDIPNFECLFVDRLLSQAIKWFYDINPKYRFDIKDINNQMAMVKADPKFIRHILFPEPMIQLKAIKKYHNYIEYIDNPTEEVMWTAISKNPHCIYGIKNPSEELQLKAISMEPNAIQGLKNPCDKAIALAVSQKPKTIRFLKNQNLSDDLLWHALRFSPDYLCYIDKPTQEMIEYAFDKVTKVSSLQKCMYYGSDNIKVFLTMKYPALANRNILR